MKYIFLTALAGLLVACTQNSGPPSTETPVQEKDTAQIGGTQYSETALSVKRIGNPDGRTLVLIPGLASSPEVWSVITPELMDYDIRLISLSGFAGESPVKNAGLEQVVQAAAENLQSAPGKDTVIMGHSLGGFVALKLGLDSAVPLSELIIIDSLPYLSGMMMPGADPEQAAQMAASMAERMKVMPRAQFDAQQAMGLPRLVKDQNYIPLLKEWGQASDQNTVSDYMAALLGADIRDSLSGLDIPLTVLAAYDASMGVSKERITSIYESQYSKAKFIDLIVVEDSYHFIMWDQAERFAAIVKSALSNQ